MAEAAFVLATTIFVATFALLSVRSIRGHRIDRPAVALFGAALMLAFGVVSPQRAIAAINLDVLLLLLGMMLLVAGLDVCGFFDLMSRKIVASSRSQVHFLALLLVVTAVLSALVVNDTVVLLMTPIVVHTCRTMRVNPVPFLVGEALAANVGSVATPIGNPQNAFIAIRSGIPFLAFTSSLLPAAALSLGVAFLFVWLAFRRDLSSPVTTFAEAQTVVPVLLQRRGLMFVLLVLGGAVAAFFLTSASSLPFIALAGGAFVLLFLPILARTTPRTLFEKVDWSILVLFLGLFIVMEGVASSGLLDVVTNGLGGPAAAGDAWRLTGLSALFSNLVSNVPAVLLLAPLVATSANGDPTLWLVLASSSTLAGNATILGAAANIIVVQTAGKSGAEVSMKDFVRAGLPTALVTLVLATALLTL